MPPSATLHMLTSDDFSDRSDTIARTTPAGFGPFVDSFVEVAKAGNSETPLSMGLGDDVLLVAGYVPLGEGGSKLTVDGIVNSAIVDPDGNDIVAGLVEVVNPGYGGKYVVAHGILLSTFELGAGNDILAGVSVLRGSNGGAYGISGAQIAMGTGSDIVVGAALVTYSPTLSDTVAQDAEVSLSAVMSGIELSRILGGEGSDLVIGAAAVVSEGRALARVIGLDQTDVETADSQTDTASDAVIGIAYAEAQGGFEYAQVAGIFDGSVITGSGQDIVFGAAVVRVSETATGATNTFGGLDISGGIADGAILTGDGGDIVVGISDIDVTGPLTLGDLQNTIGTAGINESFVGTGEGGDLVLGLVNLTRTPGLGPEDAESVMSVAGISATVETGEGEDFVIGIVNARLPVTDSYFGFGIHNSKIDTGADNDVVIALSGVDYGAPAEVVEPLLSGGIGIIQSTVELGEGDDFVFARGTDNGAGVALSIIFGDAGNDVFDLQRGTFTVNGGDDFDTLVLEEAFSDYSITKRVREIEGEQKDIYILTNDAFDSLVINAIDVELFIFDGVQYSVDDLIPPS